MQLLTLAVLFHVIVRAANGEPFTSLVNLEKLYTLEDELISIADVILKQEKYRHEGEDFHDLEKIESKVEYAKEIHRKVGGENTTEFNITQYVVHPVNVFHLTRRLAKEWHYIVKVLHESKTCIMPMRYKVDNMRDIIPTEEQLLAVGKSMINLQQIYDISVDEIIKGDIFGNWSIEPLSLDDQYILARAAYDAGEINLAIDWLLKVISAYTNETDVDFSMPSALNLLSSAYFKLKRLDDALATVNKVLEMDTDNMVARRNKKFMSQKLGTDEDNHKDKAEKRKREIILALCSGKTVKEISKQSLLKCTYLYERNQPTFTRPKVKAEIMNYKPFIVLFHNLTTGRMQNATLRVGQEMMREFMYEQNRYRSRYGMERVKIHTDNFDKDKLIPQLQDRLHNIQLTSLQPTQSNLVVRNIGMEGHTATEIVHPAVERFFFGSFIIFLSEVEYGGEIVFPFSKTKITPLKGSVLFYEKKAHAKWSICPIVLDTEWIAEYPLYDAVNRDICHKEKIIRPKLS